MSWSVLAAVTAALAVGTGLPPAGLPRLRGSPPEPRWAGLTGRLGALADRLRRWAGGGESAGSPPAEVACWCDLLAVAVEAGLPLRGALRAVVDAGEGPARDRLARVLEQLDLGIDDQRAWLSLGDDPGWHDAARDVARSVRHGLAAAQALRGHARQARLAARADALVRARRAGVLAVVPLVVCILPAFVLVGVVPVFGGLLGGLGGLLG